jgi:hypothetical protein
VPLSKLGLPPESGRYTATAGAAVLAGQAAGGLSRARRDQLGAPLTVAAEWLCSVGEYAYLGAFYRSLIGNGESAFLIDLIAGYAVPLECEAIFLPGSPQLSGVSGLAHQCSATMEVKAPARDAIADAALVASYAAAVGGLPVMALTPSMNGYGVRRGATVIRTQPGLGPSAIREDRYNTVSIVSAGWNVGPADFNYLNAFYFTATAEGALPFLIEAVADHPDARQLKARFVPGSFATRGVSGLTYSISANVEIVPVLSPDYDAGALAAYADLGGDWPDSLVDLERLVNIDMPGWD